MSSPKAYPDFHPDRPITSAAQDNLSFKVKSLVKNIIVERLGEIGGATTADDWRTMRDEFEDEE